VTTIKDGAFWGCSSLTSITVPHGVTIVPGAFDSGTTVTYPDGEEYLKKEASPLEHAEL
jgi:hypothetical protein